MNGELTALILDVIILGFLIATIFYAIRLSKSLSDFKAHRREFGGVITSLLSSIDQAERSIKSLKQVSVHEAAELERLIKQSKLMFEDLQIINEAGENMAKRLENLAEKNREIAQRNHPRIGLEADEKIHSKVPFKSKVKSGGRLKKDYKSTLKAVDKDDIDPDLPSFMIQDREFADTSEADDDISGLTSKAEQELLAALHNNQNNGRTHSKRGRTK